MQKLQVKFPHFLVHIHLVSVPESIKNYTTIEIIVYANGKL